LVGKEDVSTNYVREGRIASYQQGQALMEHTQGSLKIRNEHLRKVMEGSADTMEAHAVDELKSVQHEPLTVTPGRVNNTVVGKEDARLIEVRHKKLQPPLSTVQSLPDRAATNQSVLATTRQQADAIKLPLVSAGSSSSEVLPHAPSPLLGEAALTMLMASPMRFVEMYASMACLVFVASLLGTLVAFVAVSWMTRNAKRPFNPNRFLSEVYAEARSSRQ